MWSRIGKNISKNKRIITLGIAIAIVAAYFVPNTWVFAGRGTSVFNPQATTTTTNNPQATRATTTTSGSDPAALSQPVITQHQGGFTQPVITQHQGGIGGATCTGGSGHYFCIQTVRGVRG